MMDNYSSQTKQDHLKFRDDFQIQKFTDIDINIKVVESMADDNLTHELSRDELKKNDNNESFQGSKIERFRGVSD